MRSPQGEAWLEERHLLQCLLKDDGCEGEELEGQGVLLCLHSRPPSSFLHPLVFFRVHLAVHGAGHSGHTGKLDFRQQDRVTRLPDQMVAGRSDGCSC